MSFVLFRLHLTSKEGHLREQVDRLLSGLKRVLPSFEGDFYRASDVLLEPEIGIAVRLNAKNQPKILEVVRSVLKKEGISFDEGVIESDMLVGGHSAEKVKAAQYFEAGKAFSHLGMFSEASMELQKAIENNPAFTEAYHYIVAILRQQGKNSEALKLLQSSAKYQKESASYQFLYARLLNEMGYKDLAIEKLKASIRLNPKVSEPYVQLGRILQEQGDFDSSELSYLQALNYGSRSAEASLGLGSIALSRGDFDSAEDHLLDALDLNENLHEARLLLGWTYFKDYRYDQAEVEFLQVAYSGKEEFHLSALFSLAQLYLERGNPKMVIEVVARAGNKLLELPEACRVLADAHYIEGDNEEALELWEQGISQGLIETPELSLRRAVALSKIGEIEEAEEILSGLETRGQSTTAILELKASLRMANEQWEDAYSILKSARDTDPNSAMIAFQLGWVAENLNLLGESEQEYNRALRLDPSLHEAYSGLGWLYYRREQYRESLVLFEEALAIQPNNPEMLEQVGWVQLLLKDDLAALATLDLAVRLDPDAPLLRAYRACALMRLGEHQEARKEVEIALEKADDEMVEALGHYLNGLLFLEEGDDYQASVSMEKSLDSQELPPEVVQLALQGPLKEKGGKAWSEARQKRQTSKEESLPQTGSGR